MCVQAMGEAKQTRKAPYEAKYEAAESVDSEPLKYGGGGVILGSRVEGFLQGVMHDISILLLTNHYLA